ncbi:hypothetical protein BDK51DRAFT_29303, partial [Blyttiomyces helicus]
MNPAFNLPPPPHTPPRHPSAEEHTPHDRDTDSPTSSAHSSASRPHLHPPPPPRGPSVSAASPDGGRFLDDLLQSYDRFSTGRGVVPHAWSDSSHPAPSRSREPTIDTSSLHYDHGVSPHSYPGSMTASSSSSFTASTGNSPRGQLTASSTSPPKTASPARPHAQFLNRIHGGSFSTSMSEDLGAPASAELSARRPSTDAPWSIISALSPSRDRDKDGGEREKDRDKEKKKGLFRNPFGKKKNRKEDSVVEGDYGHFSDGEFTRRSSESNGRKNSGSGEHHRTGGIFGGRFGSSKPPTALSPRSSTAPVLPSASHDAHDDDPAHMSPLRVHHSSPNNARPRVFGPPTSSWTAPESWKVRDGSPVPPMPPMPIDTSTSDWGTGRGLGASAEDGHSQDGSTERIPRGSMDDTGGGGLEDGRSWKGSVAKTPEDRPSCLRLFRSDSTFATISARESTTTQELLSVMGRKSLITDLSNYEIRLVRHGTDRILRRDERPLQIQRQLFEELGYVVSDRMEQLGREDNTYVCKFLFKEISTGNEINPNYWKAPSLDPAFISLSGFQLTAMPVVIFRFAGDIRHLDVSRNPNIHDLPNDLAQSLTALRVVSMNHNEILKFPRSLQLVTTLVMIDLSNNRMRSLEGTGIGSLTRLVKLNIAGNLVDRFPEDIARGCTNLAVLGMANNRLAAFPHEVCAYMGRSLTELDVGFNRIRGSIPDEIGNLDHLTVLRFPGNRVEGALPPRFGELVELEELDGRANRLGAGGGADEDVVGVLGRCPKLRCVELDGNYIRWVGPPHGRNLVDDEDDRDETQHVDFAAVERFSMGCQGAAGHVLGTGEPPLPMAVRMSNLSATLADLNLSRCGLESLPTRFFLRVPGLVALNVSGNRLRALPSITFQIDLDPLDGPTSPVSPSSPASSASGSTPRQHGNVRGLFRLRELNVSYNLLESLPDELGDLVDLAHLECQGNRLRTLPAEIWRCGKLRLLNASSNLLELLPTPFPDDAQLQADPAFVTFDRGMLRSAAALAASTPLYPLPTSSSASSDDEPSPPPSQTRHLPPLSRSLQSLYLTDNRLTDDLYIALHHLPNLTTLHVSFNEITDITPWLVAIGAGAGGGGWFQKLRVLHLSGNGIASLPGEIERMRGLRALFLNGNKLSTVPGEVGKLNRLVALDLGAQVGGRGEGSGLRYNVSNWPYDWNWNWNLDLKYLNLSGNKRLEIKPTSSSGFLASNNPLSSTPTSITPTNPSTNFKPPTLRGAPSTSPSSGSAFSPTTALTTTSPPSNRRDLTDFNALTNLRLLGLIDVTCLIVPPDETGERRVRTTGSDVPVSGVPGGVVRYGVADALAPGDPSRGEEAHVLGVWDLVVPKFRGRDSEALFGVFDGRGTAGGMRIAKYLNEWFGWVLANELDKLEKEPESRKGSLGSLGGRERRRGAAAAGAAGAAAGDEEVVLDSAAIATAIRRTFLTLNRELGAIATAPDSAAAADARRQAAGSRSGGAQRGTPLAEVFVVPEVPNLHGASATIVFLHGARRRPRSTDGVGAAATAASLKCEMHIANVGDGLAVVSRAGGCARVLSRLHALDVGRRPRRSDDAADDSDTAAAAGSDDDAAACETARVQAAGGWVSPLGLVDGKVELTRAFGCFPVLGPVNADPWIRRVELDFGDDLDAPDPPPAGSLSSGLVPSWRLGGSNSTSGQALGAVGGAEDLAEDNPAPAGGDEFVVLTSGAVWRAVGRGADGAQRIVDIARSAAATGGAGSAAAAPASGISKSASGLQAPQAKTGSSGGWGTAAMKVRDVALSLGSGTAGGPGGFLVMVLGLRDLVKRSAWWGAAAARRGSAESEAGGVVKNEVSIKEKKRRGEELGVDATLHKEISPPTGRVALVFTDIKSSTAIWESNPVAMRAALRLHHATMRRLLRQCAGYEVKTEGDAFMVSFQNILHAIEWCLVVQGELMAVDWPQEILTTQDGGE